MLWKRSICKTLYNVPGKPSKVIESCNTTEPSGTDGTGAIDTGGDTGADVGTTASKGAGVSTAGAGVTTATGEGVDTESRGASVGTCSGIGAEVGEDSGCGVSTGLVTGGTGLVVGSTGIGVGGETGTGVGAVTGIGVGGETGTGVGDVTGIGVIGAMGIGVGAARGDAVGTIGRLSGENGIKFCSSPEPKSPSPEIKTTGPCVSE